MKSESIVKLAEALSKAQGEMPAAPMNSVNPFLKNKYADLGAIIKTAQPVLKKHGLSISQLTTSDNGDVGIITVLIHSSGEFIESTITLPLGESKGISQAQAAGAIITYLRRYSYAAILGMYADEDTDGNQPQKATKQKTTQPKATKQKADFDRPYSPEAIRDKLNNKATSYSQFEPTDKQLNLLRYGLELCFVGIEGDALTDHRHTLLNYLTGSPSTKDIDGQHFKAILEDWLQISKVDGGDYDINQYAPAEAMAIYNEALKDEGQQELI